MFAEFTQAQILYYRFINSLTKIKNESMYRCVPLLTINFVFLKIVKLWRNFPNPYYVKNIQC